MKRLVLVGGGNSHAAVLKRFAASPQDGVELVLVSPVETAVYSGMVPGLIAGDYLREECELDLARLAKAANARFVRDRAIGLRPEARSVLLEGGAPLEFDLASIDVGSATAVPGAAADGGTLFMPVKPISRFIEALDVVAKWAARGELSRIGVVGGGAAGTEVGLTLSYRLNRKQRGAVGITIISRDRSLVSDRGPALAGAMERMVRARGMSVILGGEAKAEGGGVVVAGAGRVAAEIIIWATGATAPDWLLNTRLAVDAHGFIAVNGFLQSVAHPEIFAAGDCATDVTNPRPRSGVAAVRQGPVLAANLRAALEGRPLKAWRMAAAPLAILNCGGRNAVASWRGMVMAGRMAWKWKDWIDRRYMRAMRA